MFHLLSFLLAPFCIEGMQTIAGSIGRMTRRFRLSTGNRLTPLFISIFLCLFLLLNSGFFSVTLFSDFPGAAIYTSVERIQSEGSLSEKTYLDYVTLSPSDVRSAEWLAEVNPKTGIIYCRANALQNLIFAGVTPYWSDKVRMIDAQTTMIEGDYLYLTEFDNAVESILESIRPLLEDSHKVFSSGTSDVYQR